MDKEWARFGSGQFLRHVPSPQHPFHGGGGAANGLSPSSPHLPMSPFSPILPHPAERQLSPSFLLPGKGAVPGLCSPSSTPSPSQALRGQPSPTPFLRNPTSPFPGLAEYKYSSMELQRLSASPLGLPYGGSNSPIPVQPTPVWRASPSPGGFAEADKARCGIFSTPDVQDGLRYLAQQRAWHRSPSTHQPEADLRLGFGALASSTSQQPPGPAPKANGAFGGLGSQTPESAPALNMVLKTGLNRSSDAGPVAVGQTTGSGVPNQHSSDEQSSQFLLGRQPNNAHPKASLNHPPQIHRTKDIGAHKNPDSSRTSAVDAVNVTESLPECVTPNRTPPVYPVNGIAFAKSSAPTFETKKLINKECPRKYPEVLSREREQQILADIQKRFSLPCEPQPLLKNGNKLGTSKSKSPSKAPKKVTQNGAEQLPKPQVSSVQSLPSSTHPVQRPEQRQPPPHPATHQPQPYSKMHPSQLAGHQLHPHTLPNHLHLHPPSQQSPVAQDRSHVQGQQSQVPERPRSQALERHQSQALERHQSQALERHQGLNRQQPESRQQSQVPERHQGPNRHQPEPRQQYDHPHPLQASQNSGLPNIQQFQRLQENQPAQESQPYHQPLREELCKPKVKKRKKKIPKPEEQEKSTEFLKTETSIQVDPMLAKYPIYSKLMANFIEASSKSGLSSAYSSLKKGNENCIRSSENNTDLDVKKKKKKKKKKPQLETECPGVPQVTGAENVTAVPNSRPEAMAENALPSIAGFAFLQRDTNSLAGEDSLHEGDKKVASEGSQTDCGYNVQTFNSVLNKLKMLADPESVPEMCREKDKISGATSLTSPKQPVSEACMRVVSSPNKSPSGLNTISASFSDFSNNPCRPPPKLGPREPRTDTSASPQDRGTREVSGAPPPTTTPGSGGTVDLSKAMCCDTCHKVGKQDPYLCSSNKVLLKDPGVSPSCDKPLYHHHASFQDPCHPMVTGKDSQICDNFNVTRIKTEHSPQLVPGNESTFNSDSQYPSVQPCADIEFKTDEKTRLDLLKSNAKIDNPVCDCLGQNYQYNEVTEGPFYTHLGAASSLSAIRHMMEERFLLEGNAIRIEKVRYTGKEGKSSKGCPIAKWILRRSGPDEKVMCIVKHRAGHFCPSAYIVVAIVAWEGLPSEMADEMYSYVVNTVTTNGFETDRRCGTNETKTCACQGWDLNQRGASFSFGCSWSMYFNGCKFARSRDAKKFKLKDTSLEPELEDHFQRLATHVGPLYKRSAPESYQNQVTFEGMGSECRLGYEEGRPFSGVTTCMDFCAHAHKDLHNMNNGCTVVVTLTKHRGFSKPDDEQLHVLPLYVLDSTDEFGTEEGLYEKVRTGCLEVLNNYPMEARTRAYPLTPKKRKGKKDSPTKKELQRLEATQAHKAKLLQESEFSLADKQMQYQTMQHLQYQRHQLLQENGSCGKVKQERPGSLPNTPDVGREAQAARVDSQGQPLYDAFWNYFERFGTFPPQEFPGQKPAGPATNSDVSMSSQRPSEKQSSGGVMPQGHSDINMASPSFRMSSSLNSTPDFKSPNQHEGRCNGVFSTGHPHQEPQRGMFNRDGYIPSANHSPGDFNRTGPWSCYQSATDGPSPTKKALLSDPHSDSPLHLLSEAVSMRSRAMEGEVTPSHHQPGSNGLPPWPNIKQELLSPKLEGSSQSQAPQFGNLPQNHIRNQDINLNFGSDSRPDCVDGCMRDPNFLSAEMEYNEDSFLDPQIGGVAVALSHGSVYFEVAKRELHATTALRRPDRRNPTRVSLVFYQHKNMNLRHHGWYENEQKAEAMRQKRLQKMREGTATEEDIPSKPGPKKKKKKPEAEDFANTSAAKYKYMLEAPTGQAETLTTDSIIMRWIDSQPMVTGPYQRWISH